MNEGTCLLLEDHGLRYCFGDGSRSPEIGLQEQVSNRRVLLRLNGCGGERLRKRHPITGCQVGVEEMSASYRW
jgi:hypothetical protein